MTTMYTFDELPGLVGTTVGPGPWRTITQEQVNTFADAADDHQWIHVDPERAKDGPFGGPIAHGFLTLALLIPLWGELMDVSDVRTKVNYGLDRVRFTAPVPVGAQVRMSSTIAAVEEVKGDGVQLTVEQVIELEDSDRPAVVATFLARFYR
ncbi:MaoC family dehydratase [Tersicoccus sp. Bi-70]|uniref:MaoC family dehydratase n=1 Tax=Tersicoccus sp. Bi-70 TaxID=1897634 RepID=UPI0009786324|nr:MaoC family dehydratase [Tersicoccus sp. Bi-70]OMH32353.1 enoyl-CoA hydratase [Tersicoccus sp. Bi-70]